MDHQDCNVHPSFKSKPVYELRCRVCDSLLCVRGMKAILLADRNVELYSTDLPPPRAVQVIGYDYETDNCRCRISDAACGKCGSVVGYHVTLPCQSCLGSCNNGHLWMYNAADIVAAERLDSTGEEILVWAHIPLCSDDVGMRPQCQTADWVECYR